MKNFLKNRLFISAIAGLGITFMATTPDVFFKIGKNMELLSEVLTNLNEHYVDEIEVSTLMRTCIDSTLGDLDPYTNYFSEAQMEQLRIDVVGGWDGVGVETMERNGEVIVKSVIENSPADSSKIRVGDVIKYVDGKETKGKKAEQVNQILNGKEGSQITVKIYRPSSQKTEELTLNRAKIRQKNVPYKGMLSDNETGYVVLTTFTEDAAKNVQNAFISLQEEHKPKQFILDLRDNGGGLLIEAVNICNIFLEKGKEIVSTRNKLSEWNKKFNTTGNPLNLNVPLIVLINGRSASASEIVAGALQDYDRAILLGEKSFGKGLVQNTKDVGYSSKVKLTTAKYYIPSGRCIQALEYKDGSPVKISDADRKSFKTANGRTVYDGGGLLPDYKVEAKPANALIKALANEFYFADWAANYRNTHDSIASAKTFRLTDADFNSFVQMVEAKNYNVSTETEAVLKKLQDQTDADELINGIKTKLQQFKRSDLQKNKSEIVKMLEIETVGLYYYEKGQVELRLREDQDIKAAIELFKNKPEFNKLLNK